MNCSQRKKEAARCVFMSEKTVRTEKETTEQLITLVEKSESEELRKLLVGYLKSQRTDLRNFIRYCSEQAKTDDSIPSDWIILGDSLARLEQREKQEALRQKQLKFLKELEQFKEECLAEEFTSEADFDEKRHAYADGDIYFEEYIYEFIDGHLGIQVYIDYTKDALKYFRQKEFPTAMKALRILVDIYDYDTKESSLFIDDDDFPDADLSTVFEIDIEKMRKYLKISEEKCQAVSTGKKVFF